LNRIALLALALLLLHALGLLLPLPAWARLATVLGADACAALLLLRYRPAAKASRAPAGPGAGPGAGPTAGPTAGPAADARTATADAAAARAEAEAERAVQAAAAAAASARFREIGAMAADCAARARSALDGASRIGGASASLEELSASIGSARDGAELLRDNTGRIYEISNNLSKSAEKAFNLSREVESRTQAMAEELAGALVDTNGLLEESKRISEILTIISEIASTTQILSFNASIVAANAGAAGKPFAVVAKEMRKLSEGTESSLKDITSIVRNIQGRIAAVAERIRDADEGVKGERESLVAVAGDLQGVMLANEVIGTVSGMCAQRSAESLEALAALVGKARAATDDLRSGAPAEGIDGLEPGLRRIAELAEE
jgi:methyl-accepting chemotaxis protein